MRNPSPSFTLLNDTGSDFAFQAGLRRVWAAVSSPLGEGLLGALLIFAMLLAFHQIVNGAVLQAASRHKANAAHAEASRACKAMPEPGARDNCLLQLAALAPRQAATN